LTAHLPNENRKNADVFAFAMTRLLGDFATHPLAFMPFRVRLVTRLPLSRVVAGTCMTHSRLDGADKGIPRRSPGVRFLAAAGQAAAPARRRVY